MMQFEIPPSGTGTGTPKKQFASSSQAPILPPQSASEVHAVSTAVSRQWRPGPEPFVQSAGPLPSLAVTVMARPEIPATARTELLPSGMRAPGMREEAPPT